LRRAAIDVLLIRRVHRQRKLLVYAAGATLASSQQTRTAAPTRGKAFDRSDKLAENSAGFAENSAGFAENSAGFADFRKSERGNLPTWDTT
jgi:hypothetical protein